MPKSGGRLVSLHDVDVHPISNGRPGKPVDFGYKAQIVDNADGVVLDHTVEVGNPADAPQLAPAIQRPPLRPAVLQVDLHPATPSAPALISPPVCCRNASWIVSRAGTAAAADRVRAGLSRAA